MPAPIPPVATVRSRTLIVTRGIDDRPPFARLRTHFATRAKKLSSPLGEIEVSGIAFPGKHLDVELPDAWLDHRNKLVQGDLYFEVEELVGDEPRPNLVKASIEFHDKLGTMQIHPHSTIIFSAEPQFVGRVRKIRAREAAFCSVCAGDGTVGIAEQIRCPKCEGRPPEMQSPKLLVLNDLRVGRDSQLTLATPIPLGLLMKRVETWLTEHPEGFKTDAFSPGILVSISLSNPLSVPMLAEIEFECDELADEGEGPSWEKLVEQAQNARMTAAIANLFPIPRRRAGSGPLPEGPVLFSAKCPFCDVSPKPLGILAVREGETVRVLEIMHAPGTECTFSPDKVDVDLEAVARTWAKMDIAETLNRADPRIRIAIALPDGAVRPKNAN